MTEIEQALRNTLSGVKSGFSEALDSLREEVRELSQAVSNQTGKKGQLSLGQVDDSEIVDKHAYYFLRLEYDGTYHEIATFRFSPQGYPIRVAKSVRNFLLDPFQKELSSAEELHRFFLELVTNPESILVMRIAFLLQKAGQSKNGTH